jgi:hypothetical protein
MKSELKTDILEQLKNANIQVVSYKSKLPQILYFELKNAKKLGLPFWEHTSKIPPQLKEIVKTILTKNN